MKDEGGRYSSVMLEKKFASRAAWRSWLEKNHDRAAEIWIVFVKAHNEKRRFTYADAVEEALCFGWIDTTVQKIDDDHYRQRFTPRTNLKNWSQINLDRFARVMKPGAIFHFASDIDTYVNWTLQHCRAHPDFEWVAASAERAWEACNLHPSTRSMPAR